MLKFFTNKPILPDLDAFPLQTHTIGFSMDRLKPGVDNIRCDVHLSPTLHKATTRIVSRIIAMQAQIDHNHRNEKEGNWAREISDYKELYRQVMIDAVNRSKAAKNLQIDYLARIAVIKMILEEISIQYERVVAQCKSAVRKSDLAHHPDRKKVQELQKQLDTILQSKESIIQHTGAQICEYLKEVQDNHIQEMREAVFGKDATFLTDILENPILHIDNPYNDFFMIEAYDIALGRRAEDTDQYDSLLNLIKGIFKALESGMQKGQGIKAEKIIDSANLFTEASGDHGREDDVKRIDQWIKCPENMDILLNASQTKKALKTLKKEKADKKEIFGVKQRIKDQKKLVAFFYKTFQKAGLMDKISATYEMKPIYRDYCPPLSPQQILQYLTNPRSRKVIKDRLKRLKKLYDKSFSLRPLKKKVWVMEEMTHRKKRGYLLRFLKAFSRYHRDIKTYGIFREAMERVNLITDEKLIALSTANNTLYKFYLPDEQKLGEQPVINHTIIKADVRGSTDITYQMREKGLNPASYFSLNFFNPISDILSEYGVQKEFIEGDAIILSILERKNETGDWYSVGRACGIAINMLLIIRRYNKKSREHGLPILELGIGISHRADAPTFLFDGGNRIMISSAINQADRLSGCSKSVRKIIRKNTSPFNLFVFQTASDEEMNKTADDLSLRYNLNGIELNEAGFKKLAKEINLKKFYGDIPDLQLSKVKLYAGRFPTTSGKYQRLIIREAPIPVVNPDDLSQIRYTERKYYEVCTSARLYRLIDKLV